MASIGRMSRRRRSSGSKLVVVTRGRLPSNIRGGEAQNSGSERSKAVRGGPRRNPPIKHDVRGATEC